MKIGQLVLVIAACGSTSPPISIDGPPGTIVLTVKTYPTHPPSCMLSVNGGAQTSSGEVKVNVTPGAITLVAQPESFLFELGPAPWHDTDGDSGNGDPGTVVGSGSNATSTTTVVVSATPKCVWACCPVASDGSGCPTTDQCP